MVMKMHYRTKKINLFFSRIPYLKRLVKDYKKEDSIKIDQIPACVGPPGAYHSNT